MTPSELGKWGEDCALRYLLKKGYRELKKNFRSPYGEVDIIVRDEETLVFVEVKTWKTLGVDSTEYGLNKRKRNRIVNTALYFMSMFPEWDHLNVRFDLLFLSGKTEKIDHIEDFIVT